MCRAGIRDHQWRVSFSERAERVRRGGSSPLRGHDLAGSEEATGSAATAASGRDGQNQGTRGRVGFAGPDRPNKSE